MTTRTGPLSFLDLARELRDMIYEHYVTVDGGYILNPDTWKLKPKHGDGRPVPHPFGLQQTCWLVAKEMAGLPLKHNVVSFPTVENMRHRAFIQESLVSMHILLSRALLNEMEVEFNGDDNEAPSTLKETLSGLMPRYMNFMRFDLDYLLNDDDTCDKIWDAPYVPPSVRLAFAHTLMQQPEITEFLDRFDPAFSSLDVYLQPWKIPSQHESEVRLDQLCRMIESCPTNYRWHRGPFRRKENIRSFFDTHLGLHPLKYRFSAAAAAIKFLASLNPATRLQFRIIILDEDRESVAFPEMHGKGLVQFCEENPKLRIERRVNIWTALLPQVTRAMPGRGFCIDRRERWIWADDGIASDLRIEGNWMYRGTAGFLDRTSMFEPQDAIFRYDFSSLFAIWACEASLLPACISLVFDGDPIPERSSQVFEHFVIGDAIWQAALERLFISGGLPCPQPWGWLSPPEAHIETYRDGLASEGLAGCICVGFPELLSQIITGASNVRLNFPVRSSFEQDVEQMLWDHQGWTDEEWYKEWGWRDNGSSGVSIVPIPPLASDWVEIFQGDMLSDQEMAESRS